MIKKAIAVLLFLTAQHVYAGCGSGLYETLIGGYQNIHSVQ